MPRTLPRENAAIVLGAAIWVSAFSVTTVTHAESIYRSIGPDGDVTYSLQPVPGARESKKIEIPDLSPEQRRAALLLRLQDKTLQAEVSARLRSRENDWLRVDREIVSAREALARAETALQKGRAPLAAERRGDVGGGSRLTQAYFQRVREAEMRVEQAKERLDRAYAARRGLK